MIKLLTEVYNLAEEYEMRGIAITTHHLIKLIERKLDIDNE